MDFSYEARDERGDWYPRQIRRNLVGYVVHLAQREMTLAEIATALRSYGIDPGPEPSARIADWLRAPRRYGWVVRVGPGRYRPGVIPKSTLRRMRRIAAMSHFRQSAAS